MAVGSTITGTQILQGAGILSSITIITSIIGKRGGYMVKKFSNNYFNMDFMILKNLRLKGKV